MFGVSFFCLFVFFPLTLAQDWDKSENIPDPDAKKPDDWDDEMDGEWEPPMITNPEYKVGVASFCFLCFNSNISFDSEVQCVAGYSVTALHHATKSSAEM